MYKKSGFKMKAAKYGNNPMKKNFPDLNKDGKVTRADVLMGRGVELNSPAKKYKSDAQRKAVHASKAEKSPMKMKGMHRMPDGTMMRDSAMKKTYKEAYKDADKSKYPTEASFIKEAKAYNMDKYGTTEPTRDSKKMGVDKSKLKAAIAAKSTMPAVEAKAKAPSKPKAKVNPDGSKRGSSSVVGKTRSDASVVSKGNRKSSSVVGKSRSDASVVSSKASAEANKKKNAAKILARQKKNAAAQLARQKKRADRKASPAKNYKKGYYGMK